MSASTEFTATAGSMEYCLLIEGVGWLTDDVAGLSSGLEGDVFVTSDLNGDLASKLGVSAATNLLGSNQARGGDASYSTTGFTAVDSATVNYSANVLAWEGSSLIIVSPSTTINATLGGVQTVAVAATAATAYVASFYARKSSGTMSIRCYLRDEVNASAGSVVTTTITDEWTRIECTVTSGAGSPTLSLYVLEETESATAVWFYLDGLQIETGTTASPWVNGSRAASTVTIHKGLMLPESVSDSIDPLTYAYESGGMDFTVVDGDSYILGSVTPSRTPDETTLNGAIAYVDTTITLTSGTDFATGAKAWIGGRELVKLGTKVGAVYTGSTRGYLGTPRGKVNAGFPDVAGMSWPSGTVVESVNRFMYDRRVRLYAHVPGEAASGMMLIYAGRLRGLQSDGGGTSWQFETAGEQVNGVTRVHTASTMWVAEQQHFVRPDGGAYYPYTATASNASGYPQAISYEVAASGLARLRISLNKAADVVGEWSTDQFQPMTVYQYRTEPGGTAGAKAAFITTAPQAPTINSDAYVCDSYMMVDDRLMRAIKKLPSDSGGASSAWLGDHLICDATTIFGDQWLERAGSPMSVKFLLDNVTDEWRTSRFAINRMVRRNVIDVLLMFLTSTHDEFVVADTLAGSTATVINMAASSLGTPADRWVGYFLHCVEGTDNKGFSRKIIANTVGASNTITVQRGFPAAPASGIEMQIRNSAYDVLPIGWGMAVHNSRIDIAAFERVRDRFLPDVSIGKFILGMSERTDILDLLIKDLCQSHNLLLYIDRTGKLSCRFMGEALGDGVITDYVTVGKADIVGDIGDLQHHLDRPVGAVEIRTRPTGRGMVSMTWQRNYNSPAGVGDSVQRTFATIQSPTLDGATTTVKVTSPRLAAAFGAGSLETLEISAMLNSEDDIENVVFMAMQRLDRYASAPPTITFRLGHHMMEQVQSGAYLSITHDGVIDPYDGTTGLVSRVGRVLSSEFVFSETDPGVNVTVELLPNVSAGLIAPACEVDAKGSDANGQYLTAMLTSYTAEKDEDRDHYYFAVTDRVELRDSTGALKEDLGTIIGFGTNFTEDPEAAVEASSRCRIYVSDAAISSTIAAGDYVTFSSWSGSNTARMDTYVAYADASGALTGGDTAKEYG